MDKYPVEKNRWYELRDDRTNRITRGFEGFSLAVVVDPQITSSYSIQLMTRLVLNMSARWCRKIRIQMPMEIPNQLPKATWNYYDSIFNEMQRIDPYGDFKTGNIGDCDQALLIGRPDKPREFRNPIWIDGSGWIAGIGYSKVPDVKRVHSINPVGPSFASCLGVAEAFREALGEKPSPNALLYSLYDMMKISPEEVYDPGYVPSFDYGCIHQLGCGAVASSLDYLLSMTDLKATIYLIDFDEVDYTNCNRSLEFSAWDAVSSIKKTDACFRTLSSSKMQAVVFNGDFIEFVRKGKFLNEPPDLVLCLANERNVWSDLQNNYPPIVLHATTTQNWGVNFGRHVPLKEWCIMCRFSKEVGGAYKLPCGEGTTQNEQGGTTRLGVLPFLSPTAAVMILAEMEKMALRNYPHDPNFIELSMRSLGSTLLQYHREPDNNCICKSQNPNFYSSQIKSGKFWGIL